MDHIVLTQKNVNGSTDFLFTLTHTNNIGSDRKGCSCLVLKNRKAR